MDRLSGLFHKKIYLLWSIVNKPVADNGARSQMTGTFYECPAIKPRLRINGLIPVL
jgi:hypothetical protein